jgi:hypothetical protein
MQRTSAVSLVGVSTKIWIFGTFIQQSSKFSIEFRAKKIPVSRSFDKYGRKFLSQLTFFFWTERIGKFLATATAHRESREISNRLNQGRFAATIFSYQKSDWRRET